MSTIEVGLQLVSLCKAGKSREAIETLYADNATSLEPMTIEGMPRLAEGKAAILAKNDWWFSIHEVHEINADGPYISPEFFAVVFTIDVTNKQSGMRMKGREIALYTVVDGKVASDQFLAYSPVLG